VRYDAVVVGGGTAGCVVAGRLSEQAARSVCLVEAGPDYGPYANGRWPADILDGRALPLDSHCWERDDDADRSQLRARILGGCSAHNACVILRGPDADYDTWGPGWTGRELTPYLDRAEQMLAARPVAPDTSPWHVAWREAVGDDAIDYLVNMTPDGVRWNAAFAYLEDARPRENLTILADTTAARVLLVGNRAIGVATSRGEIAAGLVVLCAGAYGSPAILLRSGIGPAAGLPVGEGLCDHVGTGIGWEPTDELRDEWDTWSRDHDVGVSGAIVRARSSLCDDDDDGDLLLLTAAGGDDDISAAAFVMKPRSRGRVALTSPHADAPVHIEHGFLADERDAAALCEAFERLRELGGSRPVARYAARELRPGADVAAEAHVRATARGFFHPTGTCAMGAVVDERCRVLGYDDLVVADASVMPTIPRVPVNLTTAAIAERVADLLVD
jgi:choline dehydrogenase